MKTNKLAKIVAATLIPAASLVSGCGTIKGVTHDIGYISTSISDSIDLKEKSEVIENPNSYRYKESKYTNK